GKILFTPDGKWLVNAGAGTIRLWDVASGKEKVPEFKGGGKISFTADSRRLISVGERVKVWDIESQQLVHELRFTTGDWMKTNSFCSDGKMVAEGEGSGKLQLRDIETGKILAIPQLPHGGRIESVEFSPNGKQLAVTSGDHQTVIYDLDGRTRLAAVFAGVGE